MKMNKPYHNGIWKKAGLLALLGILMILLPTACTGSASQPTGLDPTSPPTETPRETTVTEPPQLPTSETQAPVNELNINNLIPMYKIGQTEVLTQADLLPDLDITSNAETRMREAGFGDQLDQVINDEYKYLYKDTSINWHTFLNVYALNDRSDPPVFAAFIYDRQADCLRFPFIRQGSSPENLSIIYAHSGDVHELESQLGENAEIKFACVTPPVGLGDSVEMRLIATRNGIVPGAFYDQNLFLGWFDFEQRVWHLTEEARGWLKILTATTSLQDNLTNWLSGQTVIPESEVFDNGSRTRKFNIFDASIRLDSGHPQYYGVLLGTQVIDDHVFIFMGFEDVNAVRYYLPFNLGAVGDRYCGSMLTAVTSNLGAQHQDAGDQSSIYQCADLEQVLQIFINKPMVVSQHTGELNASALLLNSAGQTSEYEGQREYAYSIAKFIYDSAYSPIGNNTLDGRVNAALESIIASDYPRSFIPSFKVQKVDF